MEKEPEIEKTETKEKEPKISYHILYGAHRTAKDFNFKKFKKAFKKADVYVPETVGWDAEAVLIYNSLSLGEITPKQLVKERFFWIEPDSSHFKIYETIYNSKKPILFADIPKNHELLKEYQLNIGLLNLALDLFEKGRFSSALKIAREATKGLSNYWGSREKVIKQNLRSSIGQLSKDLPQLKDKKEIEVLLTLGMGHPLVYYDLKKEGESVFREFTETPFVLNVLGEIDKRLRFSKNKEISDELLAKFIIDELLFAKFKKITPDSNKLLKVNRKILSKLNLKDIEEISKELGERPNKDIVERLEARDIKIPKTEEEMDEMLGIKK